jgi:predicted porin
MTSNTQRSVVRSVLKNTFARKSLAALIATLISVPVLAGPPTVYGKIHLTANQYDLEKNDFAPAGTGFSHLGATQTTTELDTFALESTGSRLGIQGDFAANDDLTVFYRLEYGVDVDNGTNSNGRELSARNIFGGVKGKWGSVLVGKNDTPLKTLQTNAILRSDIDRFNDSPLGDIGTYIVGENRPDNVIQYSSPVLAGGLAINVSFISAEETGVPVSATNEQDDNNFASGQSISISYGKPTWFIGVAADSNVATTDAVRVVGEVVLGSVQLGAIYQTAERHEDQDSLGGFSSFVGTTPTGVGAQNGLNPLSEWDGASGNAFKEQDGYVVNALWNIGGPWVAKAQYASSTTTPDNPAYSDAELDGFIVGVDYKLNSNARLFVTYASVDVKGDAAISSVTTTDKASAVGFDFKF